MSEINDLKVYLATLQEMVNGEANTAFKKKAYQTALDLVKKGDNLYTVATGERKVPGIGEKIKQHLAYFYNLAPPKEQKEVDALNLALREENQEKVRILELFKTVEGVGEKTAEQWYLARYKTLADVPLREVTAKQRAGIIHHSAITERIPYGEIYKYEGELRKKLPGIIFTIAGSYRRRKPTSGDIDILLLLPTNKEEAEEVKRRFLEAANFLEVLASGEKKINAIVEIGGLARRIDVEFTPPSQYAIALLYFTGSKEFNVRMRSIANQQGFHLEEKYLSTPYRADLRERLRFLGKIPSLEDEKYRIVSSLTPQEQAYFYGTGNLYYVDVRTEEEVFQILGMNWIPPEERD